MGIKISNILGKPKRLTKTFEGDDGSEEELVVDYQAGKITPAWMAEQQAKAAEIVAAGDGEAADLAAQVFGVELIALMLSEVVVSWNVLDDDDKPVATDYETLRTLGVGILAPIWALIQEDTGDLGNGGGTSDAGSR